MHRRGMLSGVFGAISAVLAAATKPARAEISGKSKVVYHLADLDKVAFVLGNIQNHFDGMGGPDKVAIALVVHGPALKSFHLESANPDLSKHVATLFETGVELNACGRTMKAQNVVLKDLVPGFVVAERGGVVRLAELQAQGYAYLRP